MDSNHSLNRLGTNRWWKLPAHPLVVESTQGDLEIALLVRVGTVALHTALVD